MTAAKAALARAIVWRESKQSYLTMRFLVDRDLVDDGYRAYAYFRWVDDVVDKASETKAARLAFIRRQRALVEELYAGRRPEDLGPEETMIADLVAHDRGPNSRLRSYIENFLAIIEFDAERRGRGITEAELRVYSDRLALAVTDAILYFIRNGHAYPEDPHRTSAARAAHITHMLRDYRDDVPAGYANVPAEYLEEHGIAATDVESPAFRDWVRARVAEAREEFRLGKAYIDGLDVLRTKLAARLYCGRFEMILDAIEADGYRLRADYAERRGAGAWLRMAGIAARVTVRHVAHRLRGTRRREPARSELPRLDLECRGPECLVA